MISIVYGEDTAKSREYFFNERAKYPNKIILDGATLTLTDLLQATSNTGLFGDQQAIFIEDLLSKRKASKELDTIVDAVVKSTSQILLYESKELTKTQLKQFNNATIEQFSFPKTIFAFLDALFPGNGKKLLQLFHELLKNEDSNFALFMLQRQVRILIALKVQSNPNFPSPEGEGQGEGKPTISEVSRLAPWQKGKLAKQAKSFNTQQLLNLHEALYQLELDQKTGTLTMPLLESIDFLLLSI